MRSARRPGLRPATWTPTMRRSRWPGHPSSTGRADKGRRAEQVRRAAGSRVRAATARVSGPTPAQLLREPGFLLLAGLVLLADLYPLVPSMKDVRASVTFAWSASMSLAAVLAYGPSASFLFLISGLTAALSRRSGRWWQ